MHFKQRRREKYGMMTDVAEAVVRLGGGEVSGETVHVHSVNGSTPEGREALDAAAFLVSEWDYKYGVRCSS